MKTTFKFIVAASLAWWGVACGDAMDAPIEPEPRSSQQLDLEGAEFERVQPKYKQCTECYDVVILRQTREEDDSRDDSGSRLDKRRIDRSPTAFDGDPVPWPLDEKRED